MTHNYDLIGIGIGPFNLSLAALSAGVKGLSTRFFEQKKQFEWHSELVFRDACMQTTFLKDLVTPVDPTSQYSFLNYLVQKKRFYAFLNTNRKTITRAEFEDYCRWTSGELPNTQFSSGVREITHDGKHFRVRTDNAESFTPSLCIGTGLVQHIPEFARDHIGPNCFHAKSNDCRNADLKDKRVVIVGGGQTGAEIFLNALRGKWGEAKSIRWISRRLNLEALDESTFVNDYFTPDYVNRFATLNQIQKDQIVAQQKLSSDGITPTYLEEIYRELYLRTQVDAESTDFEIVTGREMVKLDKHGDEFNITVRNDVRGEVEHYYGEVTILATGFKNRMPQCLEPILPLIERDAKDRPILEPSFKMKWSGPAHLNIYAVNFGRHSHGIAEPQISLMAWRSATILNDVLKRDHFSAKDSSPAFIRH
ncbi:MAG: SidA/IucD/PvdA family monooxygenase [Bdellovibrionota bacterium]|nr:MAG: lysine 6-monooxygenase [Pseudomonadota bacterium]